MGSVKPIVEHDVIFQLLHESFVEPIQAFAPVESGLIARVFSFRVGKTDYILRFTQSNMGSYQKELFVSQNLVAANVPIPDIVKTGSVGELFYAISKKMPGRELNTLSKDEYFQTLPSHAETLCGIHQTDICQQPGYGDLDENGVGNHPSWEAWLLSVNQENPEDFYGMWHTMFENTFLDRPFFELVYDHMADLFQFLPQKRYLVHGDYGYNNVLAENGQITAVLDWEHARYGDFVYDIAWISFWRQEYNLPEYFKSYYAEQGMDVTHFEQRLACYTCYMGLDGMRFFAKTNNPDAYQAVCDTLRIYLPN